MSIATDEAEERYPNTYEDELTANFTHSREQAAYIAGRTAEPTEAEIEAAARVFFGNLHYPSASLDWDKASDQVKDNWRLKTRLALTAARKAVTA
jgi:hypothetical protein